MRAKFLRFEESRARVFDEIGIYRTSLPVAFALRATYEQHFSNCRRVRLNYRTLSARAARTNEYGAQTAERLGRAGKK